MIFYYTKQDMINKFKSAKERDYSFICDFGCGFRLLIFEEKLNIEKIRLFMRSLVFGAQCPFNHPEYNDFINILNPFSIKTNSDINFISSLYLRYGKLFGGNHFFEYGKVKGENKYYVLVHNGCDGIYPTVLKQTNNIVIAANICINYATSNRKFIIDNFKKMFNIDGFELDQIHHGLDFDEDYGHFLFQSVSKPDLENGNIYAGGPWQESYIIEPAYTDRYVAHGHEIYVKGKAPLYVRLLKQKNYINFENYRRYYIASPRLKQQKKIKTFQPKIIVRSNNDF